MAQELRGKWVLLTGAASGIGRETVLLLAREGCRFVLVDIDEEGLRSLERHLESMGCEAFSRAVDITSKEQVRQLAGEVNRKIGAVDVLVNNAGMGYQNDLRHTPEEDWERLMSVNFNSVLYMTNAFLPSMITRGGGQIVNMSTGQVFFPVPTWGAYAASKAALATYSECLTWELAPFRIRVTTVYPGLVKTPFYNVARAMNPAQKLILWYVNALGSRPEAMARKIVKGIRHRKRRVIQSGLNWLTYLGKRAAPLGFDLGGDAFAMALCDRRRECREF